MVKTAVSLVTGGVVTADLLLDPLPTELRQVMRSSGAAITCPGTLLAVPPDCGQEVIAVASVSSMASVARSGFGVTPSSASTMVTRPALSTFSSSLDFEFPKKGMLLQAVSANRAVATSVR